MSSHPSDLVSLSEKLKLKAKVLADLGVEKHGEDFLFYERDGSGKILTTVTRRPDGGKFAEKGSPRGLTYSHPFHPPSMSEYLWITEGASDTAAAMGLGLVAIGRPSAHGGIELLKDLLSKFEPRHIVLVSDNDEAGRLGTLKLSKELLPICQTVRAIAPPNAVNDLREWATEGDAPCSREELLGVASLATPFSVDADEDVPRGALPNDGLLRKPIVTWLSSIEPREVEWLWPDRFAIGKISMICGDPDLGKSTLCLDIASRVTTGCGWPDSREKMPPGSVVLLSAEDDSDDTIAPRALAAGANTSRICKMECVQFVDQETGASAIDMFTVTNDIPALEDLLDQMDNPRLVIIDPVSSYMGATDTHKNAEVRSALLKLKNLASERRVAVILVSHLNKTGDQKAIYRVSGSLAFSAASRSVYGVVPDETDEDRRLFLRIKNNLTKEKTGLAFKVVSTEMKRPVISWESEAITNSAEEALSGTRQVSPETEEAIDFLRSELSAGPVMTTDVKRAASEAGMTWRTVERAKSKLGVRAKKNGMGGWSMSLPER